MRGRGRGSWGFFVYAGARDGDMRRAGSQNSQLAGALASVLHTTSSRQLLYSCKQICRRHSSVRTPVLGRPPQNAQTGARLWLRALFLPEFRAFRLSAKRRRPAYDSQPLRARDRKRRAPLASPCLETERCKTEDPETLRAQVTTCSRPAPSGPSRPWRQDAR